MLQLDISKHNVMSHDADLMWHDANTMCQDSRRDTSTCTVMTTRNTECQNTILTCQRTYLISQMQRDIPRFWPDFSLLDTTCEEPTYPTFNIYIHPESDAIALRLCPVHSNLLLVPALLTCHFAFIVFSPLWRPFAV
jgi:hypothetical protein